MYHSKNKILRPQDQASRSVANSISNKAKSLPAVQPGKIIQEKRVIQLSLNPASKAGLDTHTVLQPKITIGTKTFPSEFHEAYEFRKYLMIKLHKHKFKETGSRKMWKEVNPWLTDNVSRKYDRWGDLITYMWSQGWLDKKATFTGSMGPKNLGKRPGFTSDTTNAIAIIPGQHRRHVISSSSLGLAIEKSADILTQTNSNAKDRQRILNEWLQRNGGDKKNSEHQALMRIWKIVHNHTGNLWAGPGKWNSAIGFIRSGIQNLMKGLDGTGTIKVQTLKDKITQLKPMNWLKDQWNEILSVLSEALSMVDPSITTTAIGSASIKWAEELKNTMNDDKGADSLSKLVDREFDKKRTLKTKSNIIPLEEAVECMNNVMSESKFVTYKKYTYIFVRWLNVYSTGKDEISFEQARSLISDWVANCDFDPQYKGQDEAYFKELAAIYKALFIPAANLFDAGGILDRFMKLNL